MIVMKMMDIWHNHLDISAISLENLPPIITSVIVAALLRVRKLPVMTCIQRELSNEIWNEKSCDMYF